MAFKPIEFIVPASNKEILKMNLLMKNDNDFAANFSALNLK